MKQRLLVLSYFSAIMLLVGLIAWFFNPTRHVDWFSLMMLGGGMGVVAMEFREVYRRIDLLERTKA